MTVRERYPRRIISGGERARQGLRRPVRPQTMLATLYAKALDAAAEDPDPVVGDIYAQELVSGWCRPP
jgi:hypothetical protein